MTDYYELNVFDIPSKVHVDWKYALEVVNNFKDSPVQGKAAVRILGEYAATAHHCAFTPEGIRLAVVVDPPHVWFCPSREGLHGSFVEQYNLNRHGKGVKFTKEPDLFAYTNIDARLDAWTFHSGMLSLSETSITPRPS